MFNTLKLAGVFVLCGAMGGCAGTAIYKALYGYENPNNWLRQAAQQPWLRQRIPSEPMTATQAANFEVLALQESQAYPDVLWITMSQSPDAQNQRRATGQSGAGAQMYVMEAPGYAILLITAKRGDAQSQVKLADFYAHESLGRLNMYGQTTNVYPQYSAYGGQAPAKPYVSLITILRRSAVTWATKAAGQGVVGGQCDYDIALLYQNRASIVSSAYAVTWQSPNQGANAAHPPGFRRKNMITAVYWYKLAAVQGYAAAENCLGDVYRVGPPGIAPDPARAFHWYRLAAAQGVPAAEYRLAVAYRYGLGTPANPPKSTVWLNLAVAAKWQPAIALAAHIFMKPVVAAAQRGNAGVQLNLALAYYNGSYRKHAIPRNYVKAVYWLKKCAPAGDALTEFYLGRCYQVGLGVGVDYAKAAGWYQLAAKQGIVAAENNLGVMFYRGEYYAKNDMTAAKWYNLAAEHGCTLAASNLLALLQQDVVRSPNRQQLEQQLLRLGIGMTIIQQANLRQQQMYQQQSLEAQAQIQAQWNEPDQDAEPPPDPGGD